MPKKDDDTLTLYPEKRIDLDVRHVSIDDITGDLVGPDPTPRFLESVEHIGVIVPILVKDLGTGKYELVAGRRRLKAARKVGLTTMPVAVLELNGWNDHEIIAIAENTLRGTNLSAQLEAIEKLRGRGYSDSQIAKASGMSKRELIDKMVPLLGLHVALRDALDNGQMAPGTALKAAKLPKEYQLKLVERLDASNRLTGQDVHEVREVQASGAAEALPQSLFADTDLEVTTQERVVDETTQDRVVEAPGQIATPDVKDQELADLRAEVQKLRVAASPSGDPVKMIKAAIKLIPEDVVNLDLTAARNLLIKAIDYLQPHLKELSAGPKRVNRKLKLAKDSEGNVVGVAEEQPAAIIDTPEPPHPERPTHPEPPVPEPQPVPKPIEGVCEWCGGDGSVAILQPDQTEKIVRCDECGGSGVIA